MNNALRSHLIKIAKEKTSKEDPSHDIYHVLRVLKNAEIIAKDEKADLDIIIPSALFHDAVVFPKDHPKRHLSQKESAKFAEKILNNINEFPKEKIEKVKTCILECSFSKGITPKLLESKILQDADGLEATGAISIMRTFSSCGQMKKSFYHQEDPFCSNRNPEDLDYALDLFYTRLLKVSKRMHTKKAKELAKKRDKFLKSFLKQVNYEIKN